MKHTFSRLLLLLCCSCAVAAESGTAAPETQLQEFQQLNAAEQVSVLPVSETCKIIFRTEGRAYRGKVYVYVQEAWLPVGEVVGNGEIPRHAEWQEGRLTLSPQSYFESYYLPQDEKLLWVCAMQNALLPQCAPETVHKIEVSLYNDNQRVNAEYVRFWDTAELCRAVWIRCAGIWMLGVSEELPYSYAESSADLQWIASDYEMDSAPWFNTVLRDDDVTKLQALLQTEWIVDADKFARRNPKSDMPKILTVAALNGSAQCLDYLLQEADILAPRQSALYRAFIAVYRDDAAALQQLLMAGVDVNARLYHYNVFCTSDTLLSFAVSGRKSACMEVLLQHPSLDLYLYTNADALLTAASRGDAVLLSRLLVLRGANVNVRTTMGWGGYRTLLHIAAGNGHLECVRVLLAHPCVDLFAKDIDGKTPLDVAAENGHNDIVALLKDAMKKE